MESTAQHVLCQYLEAINDKGAAEGTEKVLDRRSNAMLRPVFTGCVCVLTSSAAVQSESNCQTKLSEESLEKPNVPEIA